MKAGVYKIEHIASGRLYIGSSKDFKLRLRKHKESLKRGEHVNPALQNAWNAHGEEAFVFTPLLICAEKDLIFYEQRAMDAYKATIKPFGYNSRKFAESNLGTPSGRMSHHEGDRYGRAVLVRQKAVGNSAWVCKCDCGAVFETKSSSLRNGNTSSCGCYRKEMLSKLKTQHKAGDRFGRLVLVRLHTRAKDKFSGAHKWLCECDCGKEHIANIATLKNGSCTSCGCFRREVSRAKNRTHGMAGSPEFITWRNMKSRCYNPKDKSYKHVGAKGVRVCEPWLDFAKFFEDMGAHPKDMNLGRLDKTKDYGPNNCKWLSKDEWSGKAVSCVKVRVFGKEMNVGKAEKLLGIHRSSISQRVRKCGGTTQQATDHFAAKLGKHKVLALTQ